MIDLPTVIALLAPVLVLFVSDQLIRRVLARRRPRAADAQTIAPQMLGPAAMPIASHPSPQATDRATAETAARRVA